MKAREIVEELRLKSNVKGRQNYIIYISTFLDDNCAIAATQKIANEQGLNRCQLCHFFSGNVIILYFTYKKDVEIALKKLENKLNTGWACA